MDPISVVMNIYSVACTIKETFNEVKTNQKQCQRLSKRVDAIVSSLRSMKEADLQRAELKKSLMNFHACIEQCCKFITQLKDETYWVTKVFYKQNFKEEFQELNEQLSQCAIDLNLGINLKQLFDPQQDESDKKNDLNAIQSKLDEIASTMVRLQKDQYSHHKGIEKYMNERFNSIKYHLEKIIIKTSDPVRGQKIAEEENAFLHIPYHDLLQEQQIGQGGFGDVYRGRWLSHDHEVAIKIIRMQYLGEQIKEEFIREISTMYRIRYDYLLNIFGICMEEGKYAFVVEYMSLGSLYNVLKQQETIQLTWPDRWSIAQQMTKGINYLHMLPQPIIHRDIKSLNILMTKRDQGFLVKIADFGLANIRHETSRQSSPNLSMGTLAWKAPELLQMERHTEASDIYALGIVFWEVATRCVPYDDADESTISEFVRRGDRLKIPTNIPSSFAELISSAWAHEPRQRPTGRQLLHLINENCSESDMSNKDPITKPTTITVQSGDKNVDTTPESATGLFGKMGSWFSTKKGSSPSLTRLNITQPLTDINVLPGQSGTLSLTCDVFPEPKVTWFFNDTELKNSATHKIEAKQNVFSLTVNKCDRPDIGTYCVHIDNGIVHSDLTAKLNVGVKPKVEAPYSVNKQSCVIGEDKQIAWKFSGIEKPQVTWFFNEQPLPTNERFQVTETEDGISTLSIRNADLADAGVYTAKATNAIGEAEAKTTLNILGIKPVITTDLDTARQVIKGEPITIKLSATGTPKPKIVWRKGSDELCDRIQVTAPTTEGDDTYTLTILNVQPEDQGDYSAKITNVSGSVKSKKCKVTVIKSPVFVSKPTTQEVKPGETAVFEAKVDGYPTPKVIWRLNDKPLTAKEGAQIEFNATTGDAKLSIPKVDLQQHAGSVICRLENVHGTHEEIVRLHVLAAPLITTQLPKQEDTMTGIDITLRVVVCGSPRPEAQWFYNETPVAIKDTSYDEERNEYRLSIKKVTVAANEGTYRVSLKNEFGETESTLWMLTVLEPVKLIKTAPATDVVDLKVGEPFEISADIKGKEAPKVQLTKDGKEVTFTSVEGTRHTYSIPEIKPEHQGVYKLTAKNKASTEETSVTLNIIGQRSGGFWGLFATANKPKTPSPQPVYPNLQKSQYQNAELEKLIAENEDETMLDLTSKNLTNEDMEIVAHNALQEKKALTILDFRVNQIGDKGVQHLADALRNNTILTTLYLASNQITDKGAQHLVDALEHNTTLIKVSLDDNQISGKLADRVNELIEQNQQLAKLRNTVVEDVVTKK